MATVHLESKKHSHEVRADQLAEIFPILKASSADCLLAGDFNFTPDLRHLGFTGDGPGIDHVLVRGAEAGPLVVWPDQRRRLNGMLLSDHAPVERTLT